MRQRVMLRAPESPPYARVVKLVDTGDLKSPGHCGRAGSSPAPGTIQYLMMTPCRLGSGEGGSKSQPSALK